MKSLYFLAFLFVGLALGPGLAHLFELPNKMDLSRDAYFTVQQIYHGWWMFAFVVAGEIVVTTTLTVALRRHHAAAVWAGAALGAVLGAQALFWTFNFPANQATADWTMAPLAWEALRERWEYAHAAAGLLGLGALMALVMSLLNWRSPRAARSGTDRDSHRHSSNSVTGPAPPRPISSL